MMTIRFQNKDFVFTGEDLEAGGAITTLDDYENGRRSYAYLCESGKIKRFNQVIGSREDIEIVGECEPNVGIHSFIGLLNSVNDSIDKVKE